MVVDVVIVGYRSEPWLERCLGSIYDGSFSGRSWIVDNDALDAGLREALLSRYPELHYRSLGENVGFGRANNVGIGAALAAGAEVVGFVNADTWLEPGWSHELALALGEHPDIGLVSPLQLRYDGDQMADWTRDKLGIRSWDDRRLGRPLLRVDWLEASALFVRRAVLESIGGFDPLFPLYYEDNDLCRRARRAGFGCAVVTSARYHHFGGGTLDGREGRERRLRCDVGQALYILTDPDHSMPGNVWRVMTMLGRRLRAGLGDREGGFGSLAWGVASTAVRQWLPILRKRRRDARGVAPLGASRLTEA